MSFILIPITNDANQTFNITIPIGSNNVKLTFIVGWNEIAQYWQMDVTDFLTGNTLISSFPLLVGNDPAGNLLRQFAYLGIGSAYLVPVSKTAPDSPGLTDWGTNFQLLWGEP